MGLGYTPFDKTETRRRRSRTTHPQPSRNCQRNAEEYNPYRYNAKRWDVGSGTYDVGFRDYDPGLNRFPSRDMYNGALADMGLGSDPFTGSRYAFTGGNPISNVEIDGHWSALAIPVVAVAFVAAVVVTVAIIAVAAAVEYVVNEVRDRIDEASRTRDDADGTPHPRPPRGPSRAPSRIPTATTTGPVAATAGSSTATGTRPTATGRRQRRRA